jgi:hypothetical protein
MKRRTPFVIVIALILLVVFSILVLKILNDSITGDFAETKIKLGYCPTMKNYSEQIAKKNTDKNIILIETRSSSDALYDLMNNKIDVAIIGRIAKQEEYKNNENKIANEKILGKGYTLVSNDKKFIQKYDLDKIRIHTSINESVARNLLPKSDITFHATTEDAIKKGISDAVLIDWKEYKEEFELVVIMDGINKEPSFRIPVIYSFKDDFYNIKEVQNEN